MPKPQKNECTGHIITLCPELKEPVIQKKKEMEKVKVQVSINEVINAIIVEWMESKRG